MVVHRRIVSVRDGLVTFDETIVARLYPTWILAPNVAISGAAALCKTDSTGELISTGPCFTFTLRFAK